MENLFYWVELPLIPILHIFKYLSCKELLRCAETCKRWGEILKTEEAPWRNLCQKDWVISPKNQCHKAYKEMFASYSKYLGIYAPMKIEWDRLKEIISKIGGSNLIESLLPGVDEDKLNLLEKELKMKLPIALRCSYRICGGQKGDLGIFGGYSFYDHNVSLLYPDVGTLYSIFSQKIFKGIMQKNLPIAYSLPSIKLYLIDLENGKIREPTRDGFSLGIYSEVAESITDLLKKTSDNIVSTNWKFTPEEGINMFPTLQCPSAITEGITVEVSNLFISENSIVGISQNEFSSTFSKKQFFFSYKVRMFVPQGSEVRHSQLRSRHWIIQRGNDIEEVKGEGVIGLYPIMKAGAYFEYESCCPIPTPKGSMKGFFHMRYLDNEEEFTVVVPEFSFDASVHLCSYKDKDKL